MVQYGSLKTYLKQMFHN